MHLSIEFQSLPDEIVVQVSEALRQGDAPPMVYLPVKQHLYKELHDKYVKNFSKRFVASGNIHVHVHVGDFFVLTRTLPILIAVPSMFGFASGSIWSCYLRIR